MHSDRTVAPYRRDPPAPKVSNSPHPAYRAAVKEALWGRPAGATSRDLAEHEVQSQYVANEIDVQRAVSGSTSHHSRSARHHRRRHGRRAAAAWRGGSRRCASTGRSTARTARRRSSRATRRTPTSSASSASSRAARATRRASAPSCSTRRPPRPPGGEGGGGRGRRRRRRVPAREGVRGRGGAQLRRARPARNRERWASAEDRVRQGPKGAGMQPPTVFHPDGGVVYGGSARGGADHPTGGSSVPAAQRATREEYYKRVYEDTRGGKPRACATRTRRRTRPRR